VETDENKGSIDNSVTREKILRTAEKPPQVVIAFQIESSLIDIAKRALSIREKPWAG
jgi:hypothetical protein